jgi:hypothetical protein
MKDSDYRWRSKTMLIEDSRSRLGYSPGKSVCRCPSVEDILTVMSD